MDIQIIRTLIQEFGLSIAISAIFVFIAVKFIRNTIDQNNELMKMVLENHRRENTEEATKKHKESINLRLEVNRKISELLGDFRRLHDADRVHVFEYHNGESNLNGLAFAKMSETYEVIKPGFISHRMTMQGIPTGMMTRFNQEILLGEYINIRSIQEYKSEEQDLSILSITRHDTKSIFVRLIKNSKDYPIGFVVVDFVKEEVDEETEQEVISDLGVLSHKISSLLEIEDMKDL